MLLTHPHADIIPLDHNGKDLGFEGRVDIASAGYEVEAVTVIGAFDADAVQRSADERGGFFMRAGVEDGIVLIADIEDADFLAVYLHPFAAVRRDVRHLGHSDEFAHLRKALPPEARS